MELKYLLLLLNITYEQTNQNILFDKTVTLLYSVFKAYNYTNNYIQRYKSFYLITILQLTVFKKILSFIESK